MGLNKDYMNVKLTKEAFCNLVNKLEEYFIKMKEIEDLIGISLTESDTWDLFDQTSNFIQELVYTKEELKNYGDYNDISYYMWELNFGKDWKKGMVLDKDNNDIPLKDSNDLWNTLIEKGE